MYHNTSCANPDDADLQYNSCYFNGPNSGRLVQFVCDVAMGNISTVRTTATVVSSTLLVVRDVPNTVSLTES